MGRCYRFDGRHEQARGQCQIDNDRILYLTQCRSDSRGVRHIRLAVLQVLEKLRTNALIHVAGMQA